MPIMVQLTEGTQLDRDLCRQNAGSAEGRRWIVECRLWQGAWSGAPIGARLVLEMLWWCGEDGVSAPPARLSPGAFAVAAELLGDYFMAMAEAVYGEYTVSIKHRNAASLAHWILRTCPKEIHIRYMQREIRLSGLRMAEQIRDAADMLVAMGWLCPPTKSAVWAAGTAFVSHQPLAVAGDRMKRRDDVRAGRRASEHRALRVNNIAVS
jgi:hypothetical protein